VLERKASPPGAAASSHTLTVARQLPLFMEAHLNLPSPDEEPHGEHGEVFTRRWVVDLILDLVGYTSDRDLGGLVAVEPACGSGAFVVPMAERLVSSARAHGRRPEDLGPALQAFDLLPANVASSRCAVVETLVSAGVSPAVADDLVTGWISCNDFLLAPPSEDSVDFVVGNPPYIRLESVPRERSEVYRRACLTMGGRADVYVGFYERGLLALRPDGALGFVCADRWMRNAYGARLRAMISDGWAVEAVISMTGVDAFEDAVDAYPAITVIRRRRQSGGPLLVEACEAFDQTSATHIVPLASSVEFPAIKHKTFTAARLHRWFDGREGWPTGSPERLALIADLEAAFPPLEDEETGTRVGIGVATGADRVFIVSDLDSVEPERLLPLAMARDISSGAVAWSGMFLVNPWNGDGLIDLDDWPGTARYLGQHKSALAQRHTAQRGCWYRTIDRVIDGLRDRPKLYLPDFKDIIFPVLDEGRTYPHHNLYWVTSNRWDLRVLGGLLISDIANLFIEAYSVRMRGGFLRFQAQYLRRIRLPRLADVGQDVASALAEAFDRRDREAATRLALPLYGLPELPAD
jgi:hypothetical protein